VVPDVGSTRKTSNRFTTDLAVDIEFGIGAKLDNHIRLGTGGASDTEGCRCSVNSGSEAHD